MKLLWSFLNKKKRSLSIDVLTNTNGDITSNNEEICDIAKNHFGGVFKSKDAPMSDEEATAANSCPPKDDVKVKVSHEANEKLMAEVSVREIDKVLRSLKIGKARGLDNVPNEFCLLYTSPSPRD